MYRRLSHGGHFDSRETENIYFSPAELVSIHINSRLEVRNLFSLTNMAASWHDVDFCMTHRCN